MASEDDETTRLVIVSGLVLLLAMLHLKTVTLYCYQQPSLWHIIMAYATMYKRRKTQTCLHLRVPAFPFVSALQV